MSMKSENVKKEISSKSFIRHLKKKQFHDFCKVAVSWDAFVPNVETTFGYHQETFLLFLRPIIVFLIVQKAVN